MVASRQLQVVVTDCPAAAIKNGVVLIEQLDVGARELWDAILRDFRPTSIPTWTAATSLSSDWVASDYAMDLCCTLLTNPSSAFKRAHAHFDALAREAFFSSSRPHLQAKCSFVTRYCLDTNGNLGVHQDHPGGFTVTFQGPLLGGAESKLFIYQRQDATEDGGRCHPTPHQDECSLELAETIEMREGTACCFDADLFHSTAPVVLGERWVWVLFYGDVDSGPDDPDAPRPLAELVPEALPRRLPLGRSRVSQEVGTEGQAQEEKLLLQAVAEVADQDGDLDPRRRKRVRGARAREDGKVCGGP